MHRSVQRTVSGCQLSQLLRSYSVPWYRVLLHMLNKRGVAIVTVSHDMRGALRDASHVLVMDHGVSFFGTKAEYNIWRRENG